MNVRGRILDWFARRWGYTLMPPPPRVRKPKSMWEQNFELVDIDLIPEDTERTKVKRKITFKIKNRYQRIREEPIYPIYVPNVVTQPSLGPCNVSLAVLRRS